MLKTLLVCILVLTSNA